MSLRFILMEFGGLFENEDDREVSEDSLLMLLGMLSQWNYQWLKRNPKTPRLYESGVVYKLPEQLDDGTTVGNVVYRRGEHFRDIPAIIENGGGDCFPLTQKIIARSRSTRQYELLSIGDLRHVYPAYEALSYNFNKKEYEFKAILGFVDKGEKPVSKARLSNGTDLIATDDHKFWTLDGSGSNGRRLGQRTMGEYVEAAGMSSSRRTARSRIIQAARIPALGVCHPTRAQAYLAGMYAAEGEFSDGKHTRIGQHKDAVRQKIEAALAADGTAFHYAPGRGKTPGSGAQYSLHGGAANPLVAMMRQQGGNSFEKRLPPAFLSGDVQTVAAMLEGHGDGDAWRPANGTYKRPNIDAIYATSSDELLEQLRLSALVLGRRTYTYQYEDHQGEGSSPIWRLHEYNDKATKLRSRQEMLDDVLPGLTYGTVRNAKPFGTAHVGCIEVEDNHNFFLADGTLVSNCDNLACWRVAELWVAGHRGVLPYITNRERPGGGRTYHALVYWPTPKPKGSTEDPSLLLGMGGWEHEGEREAERQKNRERVELKKDAILRGVHMGLISPQAVRAALAKKSGK